MSRSGLIGWSIRTDVDGRSVWRARPGARLHSFHEAQTVPSRCLLKPDAGAQTCALRKPNQHAQAESVDLSVLDLGYPSLRDTEALRASICVSRDLLSHLLIPDSSLA